MKGLKQMFKEDNLKTTIFNSNTIYAVLQMKNMHVYFLVIFHCLLDKEMETYVICILKVMKRLRC